MWKRSERAALARRADGFGVSLKKPKVSTPEFGHLSHLSQVERPKVPKVSKVEPGHLSNGHFDDKFEERAGILEYDGGLSRTEAEARAAAEFPELPDFLRRVQ